MTSGNGLCLVPDHRAESTVATVTGTLTPANCGALRDGVLKVATDAPTSVIADIRGLDIGDATLLAVFAVIAVRIDAWPAIPFAVVTDRPDHVAQLARQAADRFVPVHADVPAAERARERPPRRRALQLLAASPEASAVARAFVGRVCEQWQVPEYADDVRLVATELVENTIRHTTSNPRLRLELRRDTFIISVADDDPHEAVLLERPSEHGLGLRLVARTTHAWGCSRSWGGGKVVWAVVPRRARYRHGTG
ncbi:anti-sigma regulatory factor (Ser/Thr protein kinase) [Amycolatopsis lexingtonensis]|uniref:Anti-sigma regulatory factor (Ser/Thr protein kinase) n=1 Tax=Amycolatopsis lexingtonensis TaxID=218822 RepID=A0ABR9I4R0_9PSEU|nr:ATP-binding protein [Amycolatopsis lexingtonensis]MBE1498181.1 anti-sigma regulatory factor (Ser/Thr protein kinase) [Amycolatopsis lexingtonensis]